MTRIVSVVVVCVVLAFGASALWGKPKTLTTNTKPGKLSCWTAIGQDDGSTFGYHPTPALELDLGAALAGKYSEWRTFTSDSFPGATFAGAVRFTFDTHAINGTHQPWPQTQRRFLVTLSHRGPAPDYEILAHGHIEIPITLHQIQFYLASGKGGVEEIRLNCWNSTGT